MSFTKITQSTPDLGEHVSRSRPRFNSQLTSDRLREGSAPPTFSMTSNISRERKSVFREEGLDETDNTHFRYDVASNEEKDSCDVSEGEQEQGDGPDEQQEVEESHSIKRSPSKWLSKLNPGKRPKIKAASNGPPPAFSSIARLTTIALLIVVFLPATTFHNGGTKGELYGVDAGLIKHTRGPILDERQDSPTTICTRWAQQTALLNGTLYIYGGEAKTDSGQTNGTWNNDFLTLDLTTSWPISSPALAGLSQPSGPPAVALGYLWNDYNNLYLYGGEFGYPETLPTDVSTWQYSISGYTWTEFKSPQTSSGNNSAPAGAPVQRAAEGAGISVPELGVSWYFGGHLDWATTPGWSNQIPRVYLNSLLEFTHPGYANTGVDSLHAAGAPSGGAYRNITQGGIQSSSGFSERADGVLVFVPGWGPSGILLGLGGGTTDNSETSSSFDSMNTIDVYDIESSQWYQQQTSGTAPGVRVNPCAVIFSAPDASSFNIYMYGGQNLLPYANQTQYSDVWILTIPSFTWVKVDSPGGTQPAPRAGHTCAARDGQMIVVGGYVGTSIPCDSPGIYSFNASSLSWQDHFYAGSHAADLEPDNSVSAGSYGYVVPDIVQSVIGGSSGGGATATVPNVAATGGPFSTGKPPIFTITQAGNTATVTQSAADQTQTATATATKTGEGAPGNTGSAVPSSEPSAAAPTGGLVAAGVIAGFAGLAAFYLGFCAWLYHRQVAAYKRHMAVANRYSGATDGDAGDFGAAGGLLREKLRKDKHRRNESSSGESADQFAWVGQAAEPKWASAVGTSSEEATPGSGTGTGSGSNVARGGGVASSSSRRSLEYPPWFDSFGGAAAAGSGSLARNKSGGTRSSSSDNGSTEQLLDGREPTFFNVVLGPRRALRVVNGMEE